MIDEEVIETIRTCFEEAKELLVRKRSALKQMAQALLQRETLGETDIIDILGPRA